MTIEILPNKRKFNLVRRKMYVLTKIVGVGLIRVLEANYLGLVLGGGAYSKGMVFL